MTCSKLSRRQFFLAAGGFTTTLFLGKLLAQTTPEADGNSGGNTEDGDILRFFIVSDAHFGWRDPKQPPMAAQVDAMNNILQKFPNLDLFLDTGDGHHNYAKDSDYGNWTDTVVRGCGPLPFFFTVGNHEVDAFGYEWDPEWKTSRMGSIGCRPYYSFDAKGIHFLVLPNLARVNYVTREELDWAALDLDLNKDKTTIVLSHNSLKGTTEPMFDNAYRVIANSGEVYDLLDRHGHVVAWMHGHNHDYKIVPKPNRIYVSNGRLGGFPPPVEGSSVPADIATKPHIGGMYVEVHPDKYLVRAYSATEGQFFDEMPGCAHLSATLAGTTSLDPKAPMKFSYGSGNLLQGQRLPLYHYHADSQPRELFMAAETSPVLSDNIDFAAWGERTEGERLLPGFDVSNGGGDVGSPVAESDGYGSSPAETPPGKKKHQNRTPLDALYTLDGPGLTLRSRPSADGITVLGLQGKARGLRAYYRVAPGQKVSFAINFGSVCPGAVVTPSLGVGSAEKQVSKSSSAPVTLQNDGQTVSCDFQIPTDIPTGTIYADPQSDNMLNFWIEAAFSKITSPIKINSCQISVSPSGASQSLGLVVDGTFYKSTSASGGQASPVQLPPAHGDREVAEASVPPGTRGVFLIRQTPVWQTRNAPVVMKDGALNIGPLRNDFSPKKDVVLAPIKPTPDPYVFRIGGLAPAVITPYDSSTKKLAVAFQAIDGPGEIEIVTKTAPASVSGGNQVSFADNRLLCQVSSPGRFEAVFA